jgi:hypothetical protein
VDVHAVSRTEVDAKLRDATSDRTHVTEGAERQPTDPSHDAELGLAIPQTVEPALVLRGLTDLDRSPNVSYRIRPVAG